MYEMIDWFNISGFGEVGGGVWCMDGWLLREEYFLELWIV